ncbi:MAG TPA: amino acid adenylation domain-containing protein, partial [Thermoanaerobaculia bacterium]|nr:amino acid adenylation domain-containing protein [Thermoanaerobaculia bacterium]
NIPVSLRLTGRLDLPALLAAMAEVVRRHEALRTTFAERDGTPFQVVHPPPARAGAVVDLAALPERDYELRRLAVEEAERPFDLERGPLVRLTLIRLGDAEHAFLLTMHHIVSDGWSGGVFVREMTALYLAFSQGRPSPLPELAIQYPDFAEWQRSWLSGDRLDEQLRYWREQLAGAPPALDLPTDRPRPAMPDGRGDARAFTIGRDVMEALNALCRREGTTLFMALLAGFGAVLGRHAGQHDVVVGSPIANRNRAEIESLIGFFVNSLALRVDLSGDPAFGELLARAQRTANGAYAHQDLPFERLVEELHPERQLGRNPVFQVMLALQNAPPGSVDIPGLTLQPLAAEIGAVQFDLTVDLYERPWGLIGRIGYALELFDAPTVDRLAGHFANLLAAAAAEPGLRVSELPLLSGPERHQALAEWNDSQTAPYVPVPVHRLLETHPPDAVAVVFHDLQLTFGKLVRRAKSLAAHLRTLGVGPEVRVGICAERSPEAMIAVFAVLEAGGAYVPLDPQYPPDRLAYLLEDSRAGILLGSQAVLRRLESDVPALDLDSFPFCGEGSEAPAVEPENAAYVIYTSGSTGRPKGVVSTHRGLANSAVAWTERFVRRTPTRCHLQTAGLSFDVFTADLMLGLCCAGARLVICPPETVLSPAEIYELMLREGVDFIAPVPALFKGVVEHAGSLGASLGFLRLVIVGADAWPAGDRDRAARVCGPATRLVNAYGVTESTVDSCAFEASDGNLSSGPLVPIGVALANTRLHLLDASLRPVPAGVVGELCIASRSLGRGYLGRPALTAERWSPDPFGELGERLYRTGDRARRLADGTVEFLGRIDHQVKVRGVRIEPGEIEAALRTHPGVRDAAVVVAEEGGPRRLVAWVVPVDPADSGDLSGLRSFLRGTLPDALIPSAFLPLDALPLTPNGKVDRGALSRQPIEAGGRAGHVAPRGPVEEMLAGVWGEVLESASWIGAHDDFFDLGGHSL